MVDGLSQVLPGSGFNYTDVTSIFTDAALDMETGSFIFMDDLTLQDAMGAFEIGEPRLDSGLIVEEERRPTFDPLVPLLPQELCWILDRSFSYEMEWHKGDFLSHTVFTLLYVHHLHDIDPDLVPASFSTKDNSTRPPELITVVLRASVLGLLKCCDLSWREFSKGGVQDSEDWQGEKCDISLLEGVSVQHILSKLEDSVAWLSNTTKLPGIWRNALRARILLRKEMLQIMHSDVLANPSLYQDLVNLARKHLRAIRMHPSPEPESNSPALFAFDPCAARRLKTFVPIRIVPPPEPDQTWKAVEDLLDGWHELSVLATTASISTWEVVGNLHMWLPDRPLQIPYLRSSIQSTFYDGLLIMNKYTFFWMVNRFFFESIGLTYDSIVKTINQGWIGSDSPPLNRVERTLYKLITPHIRGLWYNPPRRRRHLMKSLLDWHSFYDCLIQITRQVDPIDLPGNEVVMRMPNIALIWRLSAIREVVFSGFQLELYAPEERPVAYWYASQVLETQLSCLDDMLPVVPKNTMACYEIRFQYHLLTALQAISTTMFVISMRLITSEWNRMRPSFHRRYKWASRTEYDVIETPVVCPPDLSGLVQACSVARQDHVCSPSGLVEFAECLLLGLVESGSAGGWAGVWTKDRLEFIQNLADACRRLNDLPSSLEHMDDFDISRLKWDPQVHPWFPSLSIVSTV